MKRFVCILVLAFSANYVHCQNNTTNMGRNSKNETQMFLYSERELNKVSAYIEQQYGEYDDVFHELVSPDIHLDIVLVPPTEEQPYYKLVTMGAGAYKMDVPRELRKWKLERAEYVIFLPKDWNIKSDKEEDYWPIRMLKDVARLPIYTDSWLTVGHTVTMNEDSSPIAPNTLLNSCVLFNSFGKGKQVVEALKIGLFGDEVNFWQVFPLYQEELEYTFKHPVNDLIELLKDVPMIVDIHRKNSCK